VISVLTTPSWSEYELLDSGYGKRLERFGKFVISRPDPQAIWLPSLGPNEWSKADALFERIGGKEKWRVKGNMPESWVVKYDDLSLTLRLTPFKHTGIFPEQVAQWQWLKERIEGAQRQVKVLNLFGYTGVASLVCAKSRALVTHVDASKPAITWARQNQNLSGLSERPIRWILDDCMKFVEREIKRGNKYDGVIMDPPVYGHGPDGKAWDFNRDFPKLLRDVKQILSPTPLFILINAYAVSASSIMLNNVLTDLNLGGKTEAGELVLKESSKERFLSTGIFGRWNS
jgi:23S rRNA (cytosine1962-C5)-methyltransferase